MDLSCQMLGIWRHYPALPARSTRAWHRGQRRYRLLLTSYKVSTYHLASLKGGSQPEGDKLLVCWADQPFDLLGICSDHDANNPVFSEFDLNGGSISPSRENHMQASFPKSGLEPISKRLSLHASFNEVTATTMQLSERILSSRTESMSVINDGQL